jgi:cation diffusion facilitator family transporter
MTHSLSVLSDALESIVNVLAGLIGLYSLYVAAKPKDKEHPYGHGKAEFISAAFEGSLIITAGLIILYESIDAFIHPTELHSLDNGIFILLITECISLKYRDICYPKEGENFEEAIIILNKIIYEKYDEKTEYFILELLVDV